MIVHLEKQVAQLKRRTAASPLNAISVRRLEKFARLEEEILKYVSRDWTGSLRPVRLIWILSPIHATMDTDVWLL